MNLDFVPAIVSLLVMLSILVVAHEWGHFIVAKLFRMRVEEFSLFFGRILFRLGKRGDTEYNVRSIPLGGFVRIAGMEADDISGGKPILEALRRPRPTDLGDRAPAGSTVAQMLAQMDSDRAAEIDPRNVSDEVLTLVQGAIGPNGELTSEGRAELEAKRVSPAPNEDEHRLVDLVLLADSRARDEGLYSKKPIYQRALVIFAGPFMSLFFGFVVFCLMGMTVGVPGQHATNQAVNVMKDGAGYAAGLRDGDRIVAIDGAPVREGNAMVTRIHGSIGIPLHITLQRGSQTLHIVAAPRPRVIDGKTMGVLGFTPNPIFERAGPVASVSMGAVLTYNNVHELFRILFSKKVKDNIGGPIAMAQMSVVAERLGPVYLMNMAASLSLTLGIMNLLPIPILDGGHLLLLAVEKIRRRKLSPREVFGAQVVGFSVLALIIMFVMYNDIVRLVTGRSI